MTHEYTEGEFHSDGNHAWTACLFCACGQRFTASGPGIKASKAAAMPKLDRHVQESEA